MNNFFYGQKIKKNMKTLIEKKIYYENYRIFLII